LLAVSTNTNTTISTNSTILSISWNKPADKRQIMAMADNDIDKLITEEEVRFF